MNASLICHLIQQSTAISGRTDHNLKSMVQCLDFGSKVLLASAATQNCFSQVSTKLCGPQAPDVAEYDEAWMARAWMTQNLKLLCSHLQRQTSGSYPFFFLCFSIFVCTTVKVRSVSSLRFCLGGHPSFRGCGCDPHTPQKDSTLWVPLHGADAAACTPQAPKD